MATHFMEGDPIRIKNTWMMQRLGLAGKIGRVLFAIGGTGSQIVEVRFDDEDVAIQALKSHDLELITKETP